MFPDFLDNLKKSAKIYVRHISKKEPDLISFGIFTDSDMSSFDFYYNTHEYLDKGLKFCFYSIPKFWFLPEWKSENNDYWKEDSFKEVNNQMNQFYENVSEMEFSNYKSAMFDTLCQGLKELKDEGVFNDFDQDFILMVEAGDTSVDKTKMKSLEKILTLEQLAHYKHMTSEEE